MTGHVIGASFPHSSATTLEPASGAPMESVIGEAPALRDALSRLRRVAPTESTVLITGETGTGKELIARILHRQSQHASKPLVTAHLAALPGELMASELFGHEQGAFTGATQRRIGRFEAADGGTLFLDEVGELTAATQIALLRVIQAGEFERVGSSQTRRTHVRLVAATNCHLQDAMRERRFREDLFYRLHVFPIHLPPLRERRQDVPALAEHFLGVLSGQVNRGFDGIEPASLERLVRFEWPGNIRQLQNVLEHAAILCDERMLHVPPELLTDHRSPIEEPARFGSLLAYERQLIEDALRESSGRVAGSRGAARRLGVPPSTLESKIRRLRIRKLQFRPGWQDPSTAG
jgi:transcriptional regulator with GAF, ATPase, and Fis domain